MHPPHSNKIQLLISFSHPRICTVRAGQNRKVQSRRKSLQLQIKSTKSSKISKFQRLFLPLVILVISCSNAWMPPYRRDVATYRHELSRSPWPTERRNGHDGARPNQWPFARRSSHGPGSAEYSASWGTEPVAAKLATSCPANPKLAKRT